MKPQAIFAIAILGATAVAAMMTPRVQGERRDEAWLSTKVPDEVAGYRFQPGADDPKCSYRMDATTYSVLKPNGINARRYGLGARTYDVVVIESNNGDSFHDPTVCFTSQGHEIVSQVSERVKTRTRGEVPLTLLQTKSEAGVRWAAYAYQGPSGMKEAPMPLLLDLFVTELRTSQVPAGVFYRFMGLSPVGSREELLAFAAEYFDRVHETSDGVL